VIELVSTHRGGRRQTFNANPFLRMNYHNANSPMLCLNVSESGLRIQT